MTKDTAKTLVQIGIFAICFILWIVCGMAVMLLVGDYLSKKAGFIAYVSYLLLTAVIAVAVGKWRLRRD